MGADLRWSGRSPDTAGPPFSTFRAAQVTTLMVSVQRTGGSFTNVIGLPMELLAEMLVRFGLHPRSG